MSLEVNRTFKRLGILEMDPREALTYSERIDRARELFDIPHGTPIKLLKNAKKEELVLVEV